METMTDLLWRALQVFPPPPALQRVIPLAHRVARLNFIPLGRLGFDALREEYAHKSWQVVLLYLRGIDEGVARALSIDEILSLHTTDELFALVRRVASHVEHPASLDIINTLKQVPDVGPEIPEVVLRTITQHLCGNDSGD